MDKRPLTPISRWFFQRGGNSIVEVAARELAERFGDGIVVRLFWDDEQPPGNDLFVEYEDDRERVRYTLYPPRDRALDAFYHPNAYAASA
jgi:hypothetical protein